MENKKLKSIDEIELISRQLKKEGKKIVTCNGSFDLLHAGHLFFLLEARKQGDVLIIGLNSDKSVQAYKGPQRPIVDEKHRAVLLSGFFCVDYVVLFDETDPRNFLSAVRPDVHCNGEEYGVNCIEADTVNQCNGKLFLIQPYGSLRTTALIERIKQL